MRGNAHPERLSMIRRRPPGGRSSWPTWTPSKPAARQRSARSFMISRTRSPAMRRSWRAWENICRGLPSLLRYCSRVTPGGRATLPRIEIVHARPENKTRQRSGTGGEGRWFPRLARDRLWSMVDGHGDQRLTRSGEVEKPHTRGRPSTSLRAGCEPHAQPWSLARFNRRSMNLVSERPARKSGWAGCGGAGESRCGCPR